ncbi:right-handed parallel beta-helix repeat-containing protein [Ruania alkalisoli]|uniref:Right-handed parallel beta-helix repeat-containing protein n=1 Tax=Ruania alkalisoli TaxID=2779775 RepID=A0A7M1STI7_9MICO|nr:right-handed parallel beta-helix repeat-containing protein [Ruania alkalisoli]QOR70880.1 right-handed parallel beta-helix repeat-containing protein [Ruania alkalisoli]
MPIDSHLLTTLTRRHLLTGMAAVGLGAGIASAPVSATASPPRQPEFGHDIFVDPVRGDDSCSGTQPQRRGRSHNGPVATLAAAIGCVRASDYAGADVVIWLRAGHHRLEDTLEVNGGDAVGNLTLATYPGERAVITGSRVLSGWQETQHAGRRAWQTQVPDIDGEPWYFRQLYVDDARRPRPRLPKAVNAVVENHEAVSDLDMQFYHFDPATQAGTGARTFVYREGDIDPSWSRQQDIDVVCMREWFDERAPLQSVAAATREATVAFRPYHTKTWPERIYYLENVYEALTEPGEWYLDRATSTVTYLPHDHEELDEVEISAPAVRQLLQIAGTPDAPVIGVRLHGLELRHTDWDYWRMKSWMSGQSGCHTVGAVDVINAHDIEITGCTVSTVGEFGITVGENCQDVTVSGNRVTETGSGGIKIASWLSRPDIDELATGGNRISDNEVDHIGKVFHLGAGILAMDVFDTEISHNHVHDTFYTGISVGWRWSFTESDIGGNVVEQNHIHDIAKGMLSDLAGIYTLGRQPGSTVRSNLIHDVRAKSYPSSGIYADEGSSLMRYEHNLVYGCGTGFCAPNQSAGNIVRNNIFADYYQFGVGGGLNETAGLADFTIDVSQNIVASAGVPVFFGGRGFDPAVTRVRSENNLIWDYSTDLEDTGVASPGGDAVSIVAADGTPVPGAEIRVTLTDAEPDAYAFSPLQVPVTLAADSVYHVVMHVKSLGNYWHNPSPVTTTDAATVLGDVYRSNADGSYRTGATPGSFGPVALRYLSDGTETDFVTAADPSEARLRNDYSGQLGMTIRTGPEPMTVTALGRWRSGKNWWGLWQDAGLDQASVLDDPLFEDRASAHYRPTAASPAWQAPVAFEPIDVSQVGPR